jgi:hypothetical protein
MINGVMEDDGGKAPFSKLEKHSGCPTPKRMLRQ